MPSAPSMQSQMPSALLTAMISATIRPYRPSAEPKLQMSTMPMYSLGWRAESCTPHMPHMPIARPDARLLSPTSRPNHAAGDDHRDDEAEDAAHAGEDNGHDRLHD
eukprot:scaffold16868_cov60-Phaeocystis_antarctica.AAC.1